jgi:hypothetical protein
MSHSAGSDRVVNVHTAGTIAEAMVIRSLLQSAGILSPDPLVGDPFPLREPPEGTHGVEIFVLDSQAAHAKKIIEEYLQPDVSTEAADAVGAPENLSDSGALAAGDPRSPLPPGKPQEK